MSVRREFWNYVLSDYSFRTFFSGQPQVPVDFGGAMGYDSHTVICVAKGEFAKTPNSQERGKS